MAEYKQIKIRIWQDNWFLSLNSEEKLMWLFLLTNQNCHISGLYELASPLVAPLTGIKEWEKILLKFAKDEKIFFLDGWVYIKNYKKHQPIGENVKDNANKSIKKHLEENSVILDKMQAHNKGVVSPLLDPSGIEIEIEREKEIEILQTEVCGEEITYEEEFSLKDKTINKQIFSLMKTFMDFNPGIKINQKTHRKACEEIIEKFGYEKALNTVKWTLSIQGKNYTPTVTTPTQLINKLGDLKVYAERQKQQQTQIIKI